MTQVITENINSILKYKERLFVFLIISILSFAVFYSYIVHSVIVNVVEREKIVKEIREKSTLVSELESKYFSIKNKINIELAYAKGFEETEISSFISKKSITAFVSK